MKRRNFLQGIAASAGTAVLPLPVLARAAVQSTAKILPFHYGWACVFARTNNGITAADIGRVFKVSPTQAHGLMDRMLTRGVLRPPGLDGRSHPTRTWEPWDKKTAVHQTETDQKPDSNTAKPETGTLARAKFRSFISKTKADPHFTGFA
jgi:hypothetical protein